MLQTFTLSNGLKVATYHIPQMRSVALSLSTKSGSIFDTPQTSGTAHFLEHMLVQGSPSFPDVESLSDFIEGMAGSYGATTYSQRINFHLSAPALFCQDALKIASEVFFAPLFPEEAIERERRAILEEIKERQDSIGYKIHQFFAQNRYKKNHPLLLDGGGSEKIVKSLNKEDLTLFWQRFFYPANSYLVLVGNFDSANLPNSLEKIFGQYQNKKNFAGFPKLGNDSLSDRVIAIKENPQLQICYVTLSFPSINANAPLRQRTIQTLVTNILGGLRGSRLFRHLRQRRGLVYDISFGSMSYEYFGLSYLSSQVGVENLYTVIEESVKELKNFLEGGVEKKELDFAINYLSNRTLMQFDSPHSTSSWIEGDLLWEDKVYTPEEYVEVINSITQEDISRFCQEYFDFAKLNLVVQGPIEDSGQSRAKLTSLLSPL